MIKEKRCSKCSEVKPLSFFTRDNSRNPPCRHLCKVCESAYETSDERKLQRNNYNKSRRDHPIAREREKRHAVAYRTRYPEKEMAKQAVRRAVARGALMVPDSCEICGSKPGYNRIGGRLLHAHHEDYSRPLEIRWVCISCHAAEHSDRALANPGE